MIAAVFDCMIFLQAATSEQSPAFACLELVEANQVALYLSPETLGEIRRILNREDVRKKFPRLTQDRVDLFIQKLATLAVLVSGVPESGFPLRDPNDLPYLNLAAAADVGYIVSRDNDLLDLMNDSLFLARYPRLQIVNPVAFLATARSQKTP